MTTAVVDAEGVARMVEDVLGGGAQVAPHTHLFDVEGYTSIVVVELVLQLEEVIGREVPPELIGPETFSSPAAISDALAGVGSNGGAP